MDNARSRWFSSQRYISLLNQQEGELTVELQVELIVELTVELT